MRLFVNYSLSLKTILTIAVVALGLSASAVAETEPEAWLDDGTVVDDREHGWGNYS